MKLLLVAVVLVVVLSGILARPQGYEPDSQEEIPAGPSNFEGSEDDGRQGRTFGLVKKGYKFFRNRIFNRPQAPYFQPYSGYPCNAGYEQQQHLNTQLPLTPFAL